MYNTANEIKEITMAEFFPTIVQMKLEQWRLVQICAAQLLQQSSQLLSLGGTGQTFGVLQSVFKIRHGYAPF